MHAVKPVEIAKPEFEELMALLGRCGDVVSFFLKPRPSIYPSFVATQPLASLFANDQFAVLAEALGPLASDPGRYSTLNRFEFEGSLVALAIAGGCHRNTTDVPEA